LAFALVGTAPIGIIISGGGRADSTIVAARPAETARSLPPQSIDEAFDRPGPRQTIEGGEDDGRIDESP
jgi:hypothetical protein